MVGDGFQDKSAKSERPRTSLSSSQADGSAGVYRMRVVLLYPYGMSIIPPVVVPKGAPPREDLSVATET